MEVLYKWKGRSQCCWSCFAEKFKLCRASRLQAVSRCFRDGVLQLQLLFYTPGSGFSVTCSHEAEAVRVNLYKWRQLPEQVDGVMTQVLIIQTP